MRARIRAAAVVASLGLVATGCAGERDGTPERTLPVALPALTLAGFDGAPEQALDELRGPMVINLWATWCAPCRDELPVLQEFSRAHGDRVEILGIDWQDPQTQAAEKLIADTGVTYRLLSDPDGLVAKAPLPRVPALPFMLFVDEEGQVVGREITEVTTLAEMEELVSEHLDISLEDAP